MAGNGKQHFSDMILNIIKNNLFRSIKYSISGFAGFITLEILTFIGIEFIGVSWIFLIDAYSFFTAVLVEFIINEHWTTRNEGRHEGGFNGFIIRLFTFELLNLLGNIVTLSVQYALLFFFGLSPLIGNLIGSGLAFPVNYYLQMKNVWGINPVQFSDDR